MVSTSAVSDPSSDPYPPAANGIAPLRMREVSATERPRERFATAGAAAVSARELIAILLRTGARGQGALGLADRLLAEFGGLAGLARADARDLRRVPGIGAAKAVELKAALELGRRLAHSQLGERAQVRTPADAALMLMADMSTLEQEEVRTLALDTRNRILGSAMIYRGSLNAASMRMAEVFKDAIRLNASAVIVAHNHPSGDPAPSAEDIKVTRQLAAAGKLLDIDLLDHLVIGQNRYVSLKERGLGFD